MKIFEALEKMGKDRRRTGMYLNLDSATEGLTRKDILFLFKERGLGRKTIHKFLIAANRNDLIEEFQMDRHTHSPTNPKMSGKGVTAVCVTCGCKLFVSAWRTGPIVK